jgi:glycosyltransferase A (GT-A) superfamily protein (DUF2064 family)
VELLVIAKEPAPGRVKTRLCPPCDPRSAALIAEAALHDTLASAVATRADRVVVALDGDPGPWCPPGVVIVAQGGGDLGDRLTRAWSEARGPAIQIGMDTPQVAPASLEGAMATLEEPAVDAVLGPALDGGWWLVGFACPRTVAPLAFAGVPMSSPSTHARQCERLDELGLRVRSAPRARDVDRWEDAVAVAAAHPALAFSAAVRRVEATLR